jgi:uncharacterized protein (TIGR03067 family)
LQEGERGVESRWGRPRGPAFLFRRPGRRCSLQEIRMTAQVLIDTTADSEVPTDLERLQGAWVSVSGRREAEFIISGYLFAVRFKDGDTYLGMFRLGLEDRPRTMDMRIDEGPAHHRGKIARCIYELDGDGFRWCTGEPGQEKRLEDFPPEDSPKYLCLHFRREPG